MISAKLVIYAEVGIIPWLFFRCMGRKGNGKKGKWLFTEGFPNHSALMGFERSHLFATRTQYKSQITMVLEIFHEIQHLRKGEQR